MQTSPSPAGLSRLVDWLYGGGAVVIAGFLGWCLKTFRQRNLARKTTDLSESQADMSATELVEKMRGMYLHSVQREAEAERKAQAQIDVSEECERRVLAVERRLTDAEGRERARCDELAEVTRKLAAYEKQNEILKGQI